MSAAKSAPASAIHIEADEKPATAPAEATATEPEPTAPEEQLKRWRDEELRRQGRGAFTTVAQEVAAMQSINARNQKSASVDPADHRPASDNNFQPQTLKSFIARSLPAKEELIGPILHKRDRVSITARRRHGKTTLLTNIALAGALCRPDYLGFPIRAGGFRSVMFYLEDDARELQDKLRRMLMGADIPDSFHLYTREDFFNWKLPVIISDNLFRARVIACCEKAAPDLIVFDNLGKLIGADYKNGKLIDALFNFYFMLEQRFSAAHITAAHPKKDSHVNDGNSTISLREDPERFFEECMGSSHFINSTGSLWGMERDYETERSDLLLGNQRLLGGRGEFTLVSKDDNDWMQLIDESAENYERVMNTMLRRRAWKILTDVPGPGFTYTDALAHTVPAIWGSKSSFHDWWKELERQRLIVKDQGTPPRWRTVAVGLFYAEKV